MKGKQRSKIYDSSIYFDEASHPEITDKNRKLGHSLSLQTHDNDSQNQLFQTDNCWEKTGSSMKKKKGSNKAHTEGGCDLITNSSLKEFHGCKHHGTQYNCTVG